MRNSSSLDWLRFMHTPNDYRVSPKMGHKKFIEGIKKASINKPFYIKKIVTLSNANSDGI